MTKHSHILTVLVLAAMLAGAGAANAQKKDLSVGFTPADIMQLSDAEAPEAPAAVAAAGQEDASLPAAKSGVPVHIFSAQQMGLMRAHNDGLSKSYSKSANKSAAVKYRPYADYEAPGYLIMSSDFEFNSRQAKLEMAKNLPADATLVIFTSYPTEKDNIIRVYSGVVPPERIKVISLPSSQRGFWARDGIPVPMLDAGGRLTVVDAVYGHGFEPDAEISRLFNAGLEKHQYYFEGGNFQANHSGDCLMVNHGMHVQIPDDIFAAKYGCKNLIRLPFVAGIGHVDERARFINEKTIVTDTPQYKDILEGKGFTVRMLPKPARQYETYVNSLIMNDRVIVPVFGESTDAQALAVYESLGLKASGGDSVSLSNNGLGSVHCITMTYPKVPMADLTKALGAVEF